MLSPFSRGTSGEDQSYFSSNYSVCYQHNGWKKDSANYPVSLACKQCTTPKWTCCHWCYQGPCTRCQWWKHDGSTIYWTKIISLWCLRCLNYTSFVNTLKDNIHQRLNGDQWTGSSATELKPKCLIVPKTFSATFVSTTDTVKLFTSTKTLPNIDGGISRRMWSGSWTFATACQKHGYSHCNAYAASWTTLLRSHWVTAHLSRF